MNNFNNLSLWILSTVILVLGYFYIKDGIMGLFVGTPITLCLAVSGITFGFPSDKPIEKLDKLGIIGNSALLALLVSFDIWFLIELSDLEFGPN